MSEAYTEQDLRDARAIVERYFEGPLEDEDRWGHELWLLVAAEFSRIRSEARAGMREACAKLAHIEIEPGSTIAMCTAEAIAQAGRIKEFTFTIGGPTLEEQIRSIPDLAADEAIERIKREARRDFLLYVGVLSSAEQYRRACQEQLEKDCAALSGKETEHE